MDAIREWVTNAGGYAAGVQLYQEHGTDPLLKRLFEEQYSPFKEARLQKALSALLEQQRPKMGPVTTAAPSSPPPMVPRSALDAAQQEAGELLEEKQELEDQVVVLEDQVVDLEFQVENLQNENERLVAVAKTAPKGWPPVMDPTVQALHDQWRPLFGEKKNLQSRIYDLATAGEKDPESRKQAGAMAHRILDLRDACRTIYEKRDHYLKHGKLPELPVLMELPTNPLLWPKTMANCERYVRDYRKKLRVTPDHPTAQAQIDKYVWAIRELKKWMGIADPQ